MIARIICDGIPYALPRAEHSGRNLRAFFGVKRNKHLWAKSGESYDDTLIEPDDTPYFIDNGDQFYTLGEDK